MTGSSKQYLPEFKMKNTLHPDNPVSMGCFGMPEIYTEAQMNREHGVQEFLSRTSLKAWEEWGKLTGRYYHPVETYRDRRCGVLHRDHGLLSARPPWRSVDALRE
ncbi:MAG: hypothetical protein MZU91_03195 [Desulfosudis oleivorans]|nr:hypothetical protein [Desulfosudis oleivorans]